MLRPAESGLQRVINTRPLLLQDGDVLSPRLRRLDGGERAHRAVVGGDVTASGAGCRDAIGRGREPGGPARRSFSRLDRAGAVIGEWAGARDLREHRARGARRHNGAPNYVPLDGTQLLYAENTTGRVFKSIGDNHTYLLISGRWYRAPSTEGPWTYVPGKELPADFAKIPDSSPMENVKASVPGTAQAQEAAIANSIPQTATVKRAGTTMDPAPTIDGAPEYRPIEGTALQYVLNASVPIIEASPTAFYSVQNGVWFVASSVNGPWAVAASVPAEIYSIPPSSPLYYVTFVQVYDATPDVVNVGYTPGYYGAVLDPDGVVVYGTGYYYTPWIGTDWFGFPCTYGFGAGVRWTPWTGWGFGYGFGWSWGLGVGMAWGGWGWGPHPWWGPAAWWWAPHFHGYPRGGLWRGRGGWGGTTADVYARWDRAHVVNRAPSRPEAWTGGLRGSRVGVAYNSHTGGLGAGQRVPARNIYTYNRSTINRTTVERSGQFGGRLAVPSC